MLPSLTEQGWTSTRIAGTAQQADSYPGVERFCLYELFHCNGIRSIPLDRWGWGEIENSRASWIFNAYFIDLTMRKVFYDFIGLSFFQRRERGESFLS